MGTGANYTEYVTGHFAVNVHEIGSVPVTGPIEIVNMSGDYIDVHEIAPLEITNISGQYINVHEIVPLEIVNISGSCICTTPKGDQGLSFNQNSAGSLYVVDQDFYAIGKIVLHNVVQPAANTNIFVSDLVSSFPPADFRVQVIMSNSGNFSVVITRGGNSQVGLLNANSPVEVPLMAGALYTFDILVHTGDEINFQYSNTGGTIQVLRIQELDAAAY